MNIYFNDETQQMIRNVTGENYNRTELGTVSVMVLIHRGVGLEKINQMVRKNIPSFQTAYDISSLHELGATQHPWVQYLKQFGKCVWDGNYLYVDSHYTDVSKRTCEVVTAFFPEIIDTPDEWETGLMESIVKSDQNSFDRFKGEIESRLFAICKEKLVSKFSGMSIKNEAKQLMESIKNIRNTIKDYNDTIQGYIRQLNDLRKKYEVARRIPDESDKIIREYVMSDPNITVLQANSEYIRFMYTGFMDKMNTDVFEEEYDYDGAFMWEWARDEGEGWILEVLYKIVVEHKGKLKMNSYWEINSQRGIRSMGGQLGYSNEYIPNPHLYQWQCMGGNEYQFNEANAEGNWEEALDMATMMNGIVNFAENETMEYFYPMIFNNTDGPVIQLPDGREISFVEAREEWNIG